MSKPTQEERAKMREMTKRMGITTRDFKREKREAVSGALRVLQIGRCGIAVLPCYEEYVEAIRLLEKMRLRLSVKEWGR